LKEPIELTLAIADYDRIRLLGEGTVKPEGMKLNILSILHHLRLSTECFTLRNSIPQKCLSTYLIAKAQASHGLAFQCFQTELIFIPAFTAIGIPI
jgi:hypothetical protein